eukprot:1211080-Alexandrium_andersonii.AAC.1
MISSRWGVASSDHAAAARPRLASPVHALSSGSAVGASSDSPCDPACSSTWKSDHRQLPSSAHPSWSLRSARL